MAKGESVKQLEEDLQKALQDQSDTNPPVLYVSDTQDEEGISLLKVDASTSQRVLWQADEMGIPLVFELTKFDVMKARALAFGVTLERRY